MSTRRPAFIYPDPAKIKRAGSSNLEQQISKSRLAEARAIYDWSRTKAADVLSGELASYAKQAEDEVLLKHSQRIKARAISRCRVLLKEIEAAPGTRTDLQPGGDAPTRLTRMAAAEEAGLSKDQFVTVMRVGNVRKEDFERQVESDNPPTITELAQQGTKHQKGELGPMSALIHRHARPRR
jgi:hypothetical protein